jgi:hypothetical protein
MQQRTRHFLQTLALASGVAVTLLLSSCGGGGDSSSSAAPAFPLSSSLANMCTPDGQKKYVRSYLDETYLWYNEIPSVTAADFPTVPGYFNALLVKTAAANGQPKDRFSAVLTTAAADALQSVAPDAALSAGVPSALLSASGKSVPVTTIVTSPNGRRVGYILFNDHNAGAQDELIAAFQSLRSGGVSDLVLDLRYNTGGFLYVAQTAASMVTGPQSEGRTFEQLRYNNKRQAETAASTYVFSGKVQTAEKLYPTGAPLPQLNLPRLYVLSSGQTCSASESIVNSLRGIDVDVILVGSTTCGKPYGFHRQDNCGLAFFAIEFQGFNAKNFGDYTTGIKATCPVADNFTTALGSTAEPLLAGALRHIDTGSCPPASATSQDAVSQGLAGLRSNAPPTALQPLDGRLLQPGLQR